MLEQTKRNGYVYETEPGKKSVLNRPINIPDWKFGPYLPVTFYVINDNDLWMKDEAHGNWFHYEGPEDGLRLTERLPQHQMEGQGFFYLYGMAVSENKKTPYFVQDTPPHTSSVIPDIHTLELPFSLRTLAYDRTFTYPLELKQLLRDQPAAYADRYKRPILRRNGRTYPICLTDAKTVWNDLPDAQYPVVLDLTGSPFAVLDLEPNHTEKEEQTFDSIMGYYEEKTIRGGRHKLVCLTDPGFKFRYGEGLELINNSMVTFYGIDGKWLTDDPQPMETEGFAPVGHKKKELPPIEQKESILPFLEKLNALTGSRTKKNLAVLEAHRLDTDDSHREFCILRDLYKEMIRPWVQEFPSWSLPWLLSACGEEIIKPREKHKTMRQGLPYLTYLAACVCEQHKDGGGQIWRM